MKQLRLVSPGRSGGPYLTERQWGSLVNKQLCPRCGSGRILQSHVRGAIEQPVPRVMEMGVIAVRIVTDVFVPALLETFQCAAVWEQVDKHRHFAGVNSLASDFSKENFMS